MVRLVEKNGYDGIDMDWEITLDKELHARMMALLRERFDELSERTGRYYYLTTALSIDHEYDRALADRLAGAVDWINIMSYDMCDGVWGSTPSHNTSMERMRSKLEHWKVFDKRKLCLGLANYGFYYKGLKPGRKPTGRCVTTVRISPTRSSCPGSQTAGRRSTTRQPRCPTISRRTERSS